MQSFLRFCQILFGKLYKNILLVSLITSAFFLLAAYTDLIFKDDVGYTELFKVIGTTILSSGVFMAIAKSHQFTNIFKNELRNVIYSSEHLDKRNDIQDIWLRVSDSLCKQKFAINRRVFDTVKNNYLPVEKEFYYKRYEVDAHFEFVDDEKKFIRCQKDVESEILVVDPDGFDLEYKLLIELDGKDDLQTNYELKELKINDTVIEDPIGNGYLKIERTQENLMVKFKYHLSGDKEDYKISRKDVRTYSFDTNNYNSHSATWLYKMFKVKITYPKILRHEWVSMGVLGKWNVSERPNKTNNVINAYYNGLVFKNQGYMIIFKKR